MTHPPHQILRLGPDHIAEMRALNAVFAAAFEDPDSYTAAPPSDAELRQRLSQPSVIALVAVLDETVVGGLVAYEIEKLEQARREIYIYDLATAAPARRRGIATALVRHLQQIATDRAATALYVQTEPDDTAAIALYAGLGSRLDVLHFDLDLNTKGPTG